MRHENRRRLVHRTRARDRGSRFQQLTVLILGAMALLGFLLT